MGKAKRLEKLELKKNREKIRNLSCLYRFFEKKEWALQFMAGNIKVSTLTKCRAYDDPQQGDKTEATKTFVLGNRNYNGGNLSPRKIKEMERIGVFVDDTSILKVVDSQFTQKISDAFILCTTADPSDMNKLSKSWQFGVKISLTPDKLFNLLSSAFERNGVEINYSKHRFVDYNSERFYSDISNPPIDIAFIKPKHQKDQKEYRFLWLAKDFNLNYADIEFIDCPEISKYCELIQI